MAILHRNITNSSDIHNPKWFPDANNGDYSFKNEKGELESTDELLLPAALNFVDGSVAPPTTATGDIYILSSGGSVNAGWGSVSLQDWVRYDGTAWNSLTPQKSSLCYDKTADSLMSFDGSAWNAISGGGGGGGNTIYTANDTVGSSRQATLTDTITFKNGTFKSEGADTLSTSSALQIYDGDGTPNLLWEFRNNGSVIVHQNVNIIGNSTGESQFKFCRPINAASYGASYNIDLFDSSNNQTTYARFGGKIISNTTGSEYGEANIQIRKNGTITTLAEFDSVDGLSILANTTTNLFKAGDVFTVSTSDATIYGSGGTLFQIHRPTNGVAGGVGFNIDLNNSSNAQATYGRFVSIIETNTAGSHTGRLELRVADSGTVTTKVKIKSNTINVNMPTSSAGLSSGDLYNDGGTVKIV